MTTSSSYETLHNEWLDAYAQLMGGPDHNGNIIKNNDLYVFTEEEKGLKESVEAYAAAMKRIKNTGDASVAFTMLAWMMANQGFNELNYRTALDGGSLKIQGDLTKLGNILEQATNSNDDQGEAYPANNLYLVSSGAEGLKQILTTNPDLIKAIGSEAAASLSNNYLAIRQMIYDDNTADNDSSKVYFDATGHYAGGGVSGSGTFKSYQEFHTDLAQRGDPDQANEAQKAMTDAFNENTSTTQSTNAASQEVISNDTNLSKAIQAFVVAMFHAIIDPISAAVKKSSSSS